MAQDQFAVQSADQPSISICCSSASASRLFCFSIVERKLEAALDAELNVHDFTLRHQARLFAEIEARARGLID